MSKPSITDIIGANLTWLRVSAGKSRLEVAEDFHMSGSRYARFERGDQVMRIDELLAFKEKLGHDFDWWLSERSTQEIEEAGLIKLTEQRMGGTYTLFLKKEKANGAA